MGQHLVHRALQSVEHEVNEWRHPEDGANAAFSRAIHQLAFVLIYNFQALFKHCFRHIYVLFYIGLQLLVNLDG